MNSMTILHVLSPYLCPMIVALFMLVVKLYKYVYLQCHANHVSIDNCHASDRGKGVKVKTRTVLTHFEDCDKKGCILEYQSDMNT